MNMSGLPYSNMRQQIQQDSMQYGVDTAASAVGSGLGEFGKSLLSSGLGSLIGGGLNLIGMGIQNRQQRKFYEDYMSPQAQMQQMMAAGINPNAAAQGISGSGPANMQAASMSEGAGVSGDIANLLGNSVNSALAARNIQADTDNTVANTERTKVGTAFDSASFDSRLDEIALKNNWTKEQTTQMKSFNKYADELYHWNAEKAEQDFKNAQKQWELYASQIGLYDAQSALYEAQTGTEKVKQTKLWKEVEFDKWYNDYCIQNNMKPDSPEAEYIRNKLILDSAPADSEEKKNAESFVRSFEGAQKDIAASENEGRVGTDPIMSTQQSLTEEYNKDVKYLDQQISYLKKEIRAYETGRKKDNWFHTGKSNAEYKLKTFENKKANRYKQYTEDLRRLKNNTSTNVGTSGVSQSK